MMDVEKEQRRWELVCGKELVTVFLSGSRKIYIRNYKLNYIFKELGYSQYMTLCSVASYNKDEIPNTLSEAEKESIKQQMVFNTAVFFNEFVECDNIKYDHEANEFLLTVGETMVILKEQDVNDVFTAFKETYSLGGGKVAFADAKPKTKEHEDFLAVIRKAQAKIDRKKNGEHTVDSILIGVTSKHPSYNLLNIWDLTVWQLMETYSVLHKIDGAYFTKIGIYTGNIDMKKSKITNKELDWSIRD